MLVGLFLASTLIQPSVSGQPTLAAKLTDAIDHNYLYADGESWKRLRPALLQNADSTVASIDRELTELHDADLRIISSGQIATLQDETAGKEQGIGLVDFGLTMEPKTHEPRVVTALVDSPAFKAGLRPGDVILTVNGLATRGLIHEDVMAMLRGDSGTQKLVLDRDGKKISMDIPMEAWSESAVVSQHFVEGEKQLGYVGIRLFTPDSGKLTRKAVESLSALGVDGCIVDLRNNPGGYLDAMALAGSAFTDQTLGWKVRRNGAKEPIHSSEKPFKTMKIVILINEGTASAAEILAAGLHDTIGAKLVGARTYGRGQIQTYVALNDDAGVVIPAASAESARGLRFNKGSGLSPDVFVSPTGDKTNVDAVLRYAVELLTRERRNN
jgi:carboxyl-terminal processing protease